MTAPPGWTEARIVSIRDLTHDIREFYIAPVRALPTGTPGGHVALSLATPRGELVRTYSLLEGGDGAPYRIAVKRVAISRGGSAALWQMAPGETLLVSRPRNTFPLVASGGFTLLVAGGIGITPIASMVRALCMAGCAFRLIYAVRTRHDLALHAELLRMAENRLSIVVSEDGQRIDFAQTFARLQPNTDAYVCGPPGMMAAARSAWTALGRAPTSLRFETFGAAGTVANQDFTVSIPRLGREIAVRADETLLEALERDGVQMISSCRKGECGLCALPVLAADRPIDHRDVFLSGEERDAGNKLCTCVSRSPGGRLVLDTADRSAPSPVIGSP
jgi:vanillate O-demethylase ferredoxin subunit